VKPAAFDYVLSGSVAEALTALSQSDRAKLLAGGQSLGPMLNLRLARPDLIVDVSRVKELQRFEQSSESWLIGAGVTHARIEDARTSWPSGSMMSEVAAGIAYRSIRNRGTVGGSLAHADPAADWPLALAALNAVVQVRNERGTSRTIAVDALMTSAFVTQIGDRELIELIRVPKYSKRMRYGYFKFSRKHGEFPEASAAVIMDEETRTCRLFLGALNDPPMRLSTIEQQLLNGRPVDDTEIRREIAAAIADSDNVMTRMRAAAVNHAIRQAFRT
jgi:aerobic carbon-monoxide dehydrogenase medium subunit